MVIHVSVALRHYKRPEVQKAMVESAADREVGVFYGNRDTYGKRPDILSWPRDVLAFTQRGATSFHIGEERWVDPLQIVTGMPRRQLDTLRSGWDLVLDIDCPNLEFSQIAAHIIVEKLKSMGIKSVSVKFSGNHGFHIGVPFEAFPDEAYFEGKMHEVKDLFPEGPRKIAAYLQDEIKAPLGKMIVDKFTLEGVLKTTGKSYDEVVKKENGKLFLDPFAILAIDTILIASRHLVRAPYSLHDKSGLVSIPVDPKDLLSFDKKTAEPSAIKFKGKFLDRENVIPGEARTLFEQAFAHKLTVPLSEKAEKDMKAPLPVEISTEALPEDVFPPCMKSISQGLKDGKKRALFAAVNFLVICGWPYEKIEDWLTEFNKHCEEPLREVTIKGHLRHHKSRKDKLMPPNCKNFYEQIGVCNPDGLCRKIKNPVQYSKIRMLFLRRDAEKNKRSRKKDE